MRGKNCTVLWTGTCDLTRKRGKYIELSDTTPEDIADQFDRVSRLREKHNDNVRILILECPFNSIVRWNSPKGHHNPDFFKEGQTPLIQRIKELNNKLSAINEKNLTPPSFALM